MLHKFILGLAASTIVSSTISFSAESADAIIPPVLAFGTETPEPAIEAPATRKTAEVATQTENLISNERFIVPAKFSHHGWSSMHFVAAQGSVNDLNRLLDLGYDLKVESGEGERPIHLAVKYGNIPVIKRLIELKVDLNSLTTGERLRVSPLMIAIRETDSTNVAEMVVQLLLAAGADPNVRGEHSFTALLWAADIASGKFRASSQNFGQKIIKMLLDAGANPLISSDGGFCVYQSSKGMPDKELRKRLKPPGFFASLWGKNLTNKK